MKGQGYNLIHIFIDELIIVSQVVEKRFLISDKMVKLEMVVHVDSAENGSLEDFGVERGLFGVVSKGTVGFLLLRDDGVQVVLWEISQSFLETVQLLRVVHVTKGGRELAENFLIKITEHLHVIILRQGGPEYKRLFLLQWIFLIHILFLSPLHRLQISIPCRTFRLIVQILHITLFLILIKTVDLQLSPHKICLFRILLQRPPEPSLH
jgi:hypothetical protein